MIRNRLMLIVLLLTACSVSAPEQASFMVSAIGFEVSREYVDENDTTVVAPSGTYFKWVHIAVQNISECRILISGTPVMGEDEMGDVYGSYPLCKGDQTKFHSQCQWLEPDEICTGWSLFIVPDDVNTHGMLVDVGALEVCE